MTFLLNLRKNISHFKLKTTRQGKSQFNLTKWDGLELRILIPENTSFLCELPCVKIMIAIISFDL